MYFFGGSEINPPPSQEKLPSALPKSQLFLSFFLHSLVNGRVIPRWLERLFEQMGTQVSRFYNNLLAPPPQFA
jgi:hypothetical protein